MFKEFFITIYCCICNDIESKLLIKSLHWNLQLKSNIQCYEHLQHSFSQNHSDRCSFVK